MLVIGESGQLVLQHVVLLHLKEQLQDLELELELGLMDPNMVLVKHVQNNKLKHVVKIVI